VLLSQKTSDCEGENMSTVASLGWGISPGEFLASWWNVLNGRAPLLSIEITRECPLKCPGCYAYGDDHLGAGGPTLRELSDFQGEALINGVLDLVRKHRPLHVSLVGGEPMVRHKELGRILPVLGQMGVHTLLVTSAVIPIPKDWMTIPRLRVAVSVDGLPEHHDVRRKPATYERILRNIQGSTVNVHWTITRAMLCRSGYLEEYLHFWSSRDEVHRIWASIYSPQIGEQSEEMLGAGERRALAAELPRLKQRYPKFLMNEGIVRAFLEPPRTPNQCLFSKMSTNYTADLKTGVEPCVLGGKPDCAQCGCAASMGLHWVRSVRLAGPLKIEHVIRASMAIGRAAVRLRRKAMAPSRWQPRSKGPGPDSKLVQITDLTDGRPI
jgi:MoaA/NifB/PqqE/SkfB family radical SAM enzyme